MLTKSIPKPACFFKEYTIYSITICPTSDLQFIDPDKIPLRYTRFKSAVERRITKSISLSCDYHLWIEISEPLSLKPKGSQYPRLHLHGIIAITDIRRFLLHDYYKLYDSIGIIDIDTISDPKNWLLYCTKQQHLTGFDTIQHGSVLLNLHQFMDNNKVVQSPQDVAPTAES